MQLYDIQNNSALYKGVFNNSKPTQGSESFCNISTLLTMSTQGVIFYLVVYRDRLLKVFFGWGKSKYDTKVIYLPTSLDCLWGYLPSKWKWRNSSIWIGNSSSIVCSISFSNFPKYNFHFVWANEKHTRKIIYQFVSELWHSFLI